MQDSPVADRTKNITWAKVWLQFHQLGQLLQAQPLQILRCAPSERCSLELHCRADIAIEAAPGRPCSRPLSSVKIDLISDVYSPHILCAPMRTIWCLPDAPSVSTQLFGCRPACLSGKLSRHNYKLDSSARGVRVLRPRAAATLTPASVVTSRPQIKHGEHLEAQLGPLGQSLVQQVEVRSLGYSIAFAVRPADSPKCLFPVLFTANSLLQNLRSG